MTDTIDILDITADEPNPVFRDVHGDIVEPICVNCQWSFDDIDDAEGPHYGEPAYQCNNPERQPGIGEEFPYSWPQPCFKLHAMFKVDWKATMKDFKCREKKRGEW